METIKKELLYNLIEYVKQCDKTRTDWLELHQEVFNSDYYIIGYYAASEWLKSHDLDAFQAIAYVIEKELEQFGENNLKPIDINSEKIVNLLVYFVGYELLSEYDLENITKTKLLNLLRSKSK